MIDMLALAVVTLAGLYLVGFAVASFAAPAMTARFLRRFAGSALAHYLELALRLIVGGSFLQYSRHAVYPGLFSAFGWLLVITTAGLFAIPWRWHHRFAQRAVPHAVRNLRLVAIASLALGAFILAVVVRGAV